MDGKSPIFKKNFFAESLILVLFFLIVVSFGYYLFKAEGMGFDKTIVTESWVGVLGTGHEITMKRTYPGKTVWDLLDLFIVPAVLSLGLFWLAQRSEKRDRDLQKMDEVNKEDSRQELKLQSYFDKMSDLILRGYLEEEVSERPGEGINIFAKSANGSMNLKAVAISHGKNTPTLSNHCRVIQKHSQR